MEANPIINLSGTSHQSIAEGFPWLIIVTNRHTLHIVRDTSEQWHHFDRQRPLHSSDLHDHWPLHEPKSVSEAYASRLYLVKTYRVIAIGGRTHVGNVVVDLVGIPDENVVE